MYNFIQNNSIDRAGRREIKILRLLDQLILYCKFLKTCLQSGGETIADDADRHPLAALSCLMKVSFDEDYRHTMCHFDALQIISNLVYLDFAVHGLQPNDQCCNSLRRYGLMALTNLTFGDEKNKAFLCRQKSFMDALVGQLDTAPDDLLQVIASVLRNVSWRPDINTKVMLNKIGAVKALVQAAMHNNKNENTLKAILSALWNLSAHCSTNKMELCAVDGALAFLVAMLTFEAPSKTLKIVENAGGILRNVSSHIAVCEHYRQILREQNCMSILLQHLKSSNITLVSNSCGTLWNLSARCHADQQYLLNNGAIPLLRSLTHSKHVMISEGSSAALKNLLGFRAHLQSNLDCIPAQPKWPKPETRMDYAKSQNVSKQCIELTEKSLCKNNVMASKIFSGLESVVLTASNSRESIYATELRSVKTLTKYKSKSLDHLHLSTEGNQCRFSTLTLSSTSSEKLKYRSTYQETDLDQLTDFSLRYVEKQIERDVDIPLSIGMNVSFKMPTTKNNRRNDIVCIEDNVKCYQTEGTPYMISNAASADDLTTSKADNLSIALKSPSIAKTKKAISECRTTATYSQYMTADNPINYCEEGTPYYYSRRESFNSLHEVAHFEEEHLANADKKEKHLSNAINAIESEKVELLASDESKATVQHESALTMYSTQETPLMFSRSSSIDSLHDDDLPACDDLSSVQSDFSRLASGIVSPSDIPDSPTQLMPRSPNIKELRKLEFSSTTIPLREETICESDVPDDRQKLKIQTQSVFEDNVNMFQVENTPAQFSCATSLSNLSIIEDEVEQIKAEVNPEIKNLHSDLFKAEKSVEEEEEEEECSRANDDELLLASCINIGMNRSTYSTLHKHRDLEKRTKDEIREYFTEDTPAMFSHQGSNTNLSTISILSFNNDESKDNISFNTSEDSAADETNILQQCINEGMQMPSKEFPSTMVTSIPHLSQPPAEDPKCSHSTSMLQQQDLSPKKHDANSELNLCNKSLTSLSSDTSDDGADFLQQAIAAGYNRSKPKQNQLKPTHHSSTSQLLDDSNTMHNTFHDNNMKANSSVDSSDSSNSDNQSKSLLELCIRTGMHKKDQLPSSSVKHKFRKN